MRRYRKKLITLAGMIGLDESALICDLAETYGVLYYRAGEAAGNALRRLEG